MFLYVMHFMNAFSRSNLIFWLKKNNKNTLIYYQAAAQQGLWQQIATLPPAWREYTIKSSFRHRTQRAIHTIIYTNPWIRWRHLLLDTHINLAVFADFPWNIATVGDSTLDLRPSCWLESSPSVWFTCEKKMPIGMNNWAVPVTKNRLDFVDYLVSIWIKIN